MKEAIETAVKSLVTEIDKSPSNHTALDRMQLSQAVLNLVNARHTLVVTETESKRR